MKSPQQLYEQMERYLSGSMRKKEREAFEEKIGSNRRFAAELESFRILRGILRAEIPAAPATPRRNRSTKAAPTDSTIDPSAGKSTGTSAYFVPDPKPGAMRFFLSTGGILLLFALSVYLVNFLQPVPGQELFKAHFRVCPAPDPATFSLAPEQGEAIRQHFDQKDYAAAIPLLKEVASLPGMTGLKAHYYLGVCYLALDPPATQQAIRHLAKADIPQNPDHLQVEWYLGLAYLKEGHVQRARSLLNRIAGQSQFQNNAQLSDLISDLE